MVRKRLTASVSGRREPKRSQSPEEHGPHSELILRGATGNCFSRGSKPLKRRYEAQTGFVEKRRSGKVDSKESTDPGKGAKL